MQIVTINKCFITELDVKALVQIANSTVVLQIIKMVISLIEYVVDGHFVKLKNRSI